MRCGCVVAVAVVVVVVIVGVRVFCFCLFVCLFVVLGGVKLTGKRKKIMRQTDHD